MGGNNCEEATFFPVSWFAQGVSVAGGLHHVLSSNRLPAWSQWHLSLDIWTWTLDRHGFGTDRIRMEDSLIRVQECLISCSQWWDFHSLLSGLQFLT